MDIVWDGRKNRRLKATRGVSFEDIEPIILEERYLAVIKNPSRPGQMIFLVPYKGYTYVVPFAIDADGNIVLKTIFPSRKFHRLSGIKEDENQA